MGDRKKFFLVTCGVGAFLISGTGSAAETFSYSYDALGRLVVSTISGGPNSGIGTATCFDPAGNRMRHTVGSGVSSCGSGSGSTPPPTSSNQAPVAVSDSVSGPCNSAVNYDVVANDYDPDGNTPLSLVSATGSASVDAQVVSSTTIQFIGTAPGTTSTVSYVVKDSLGATATGSVSYRTTGTQSTCFQ